MVSTDNGECNGGIEEGSLGKVRSLTALHISTSQRGLISDQDSQSGFQASLANRLRFLKFGNLSSPSAKFYQIAQEREDVSRTVPSSSSLHIRERVNRLFSHKIDWPSLWNISKEWIRNPMNLALFIWILCVAVSGAILFLVMTGMLNHALPKKSERDAWFEVNNQILNALFTLMCLYQHPKRFYHLVLLLRWRPEDVTKLRKIYCKHGTYKPHEWMHMMVVVILLHLNCFAQYALCGLNLGYKRSERPAIGVGITISFAIGAPAAAGVYSMLSPLGRDYASDLDEEAQLHVAPESSTSNQPRRQSLEKRFSFALRSDDGRVVETSPSWSGGIFDFWDDISLAYLSLFCTFCVFGWNMERLGFGNMYVHIATFLLFCMAPFWIFNLAAVNINNETVREALGVTGIFLCVFGLLYGGFWRIQMRKRFNLPPYNFCCNKPAIADCALWLCCCWCSLAQEVRTGNAYDIVEDKFYRKQDDDTQAIPISPLPREDGEFQFRASPSPVRSPSPTHLPLASSPSPSRFSKERNSPGRHLPSVEEGYAGPINDTSSSPSHYMRASSPSPSRFSKEYNSPGSHLPSGSDKGSKDDTMTPPAPSSISR
ncbi:OLC1v1026925C1 [Oldenlandia corymbosa var. corymbosa]|uniref:OLC1v1026925C1 n=1 Tax=Oldenlandia corymbosa var. corymbosa TaxID=529605 RepID=A0AAV1CAY1_OLDCO|nr:OLC1v1026925C1 [Oldenlandia corymbosa var. corymbosa]